MKKVLIITYYWPPAGGAGVQRWLKFVKYLRDFGWEPIIYTALNPEMPVIDESLTQDIPKDIEVLKQPIWEPYAIYKKFTGKKPSEKINASFLNEGKKQGITQKISVWLRGNFFIPDARRFWIKPSIKVLSAYIQKHSINYIVSSGPPHSMHLIALGLKKKFPKIKWLADFRDPWTNIDFYEKLMLSPMANAKHHRLELLILKHANIVLSIGNDMSNEFKTILKTKENISADDKFKVITNGFDESDYSDKLVQKDFDFSITHIGTLVKDRNPNELWKVLSQLVSENENFKQHLKIKLIGKVDVFVLEQLNKFGLTPYLQKIDYIPHNQVAEEQKKSKVLLLLVNRTKNAKGILTGKFFEYMASGTPILTIGPTNGDLAEIINKTQCGIISNFDDLESLKKNVLHLFLNENNFNRRSSISEFSRKNLTKQLADVLNKM
ncbi:MAG: glycosyl transferase family 1 [Bacteroidetes bacterium]|nr:glycosyl transferase family 1 [Bacteroidota bacterium]